MYKETSAMIELGLLISGLKSKPLSPNFVYKSN